MKKVIFNLASLICFGSLSAQHTFSICAVDPLTGEVGSAGASCIENSHIISDVHPGVGVVHTQAYYIAANQNYAEELMNLGVSPAAIIDSMVANDIANNSAFRQYGVVDLVDGGRSAAFTGENTMDWKGHITGPTYSIQGNILLGPSILENMEANFNSTEGNLACKLMAALQGAKVPGADTRCAEFNISALSSFITVAQPDDAPGDFWLDLRVNDVHGDSIDPIDSLQTLFSAIGGCAYTGVNNSGYLAPTIYPQPSTDLIVFQLNGQYESIEIYAINGAIIFSNTISGSNSTTINCSTWEPGIYVYQLSTQTSVHAGKILVE